MRRGFLFAFLFLPFISWAQIPVVINEVMVTLPGGRGPNSMIDYDSLTGNTPLDDAQWFELYNPDPCHSYDMGCYVISSNMTTGGVSNYGMFPLPGGTVIPPLGHLLVGGNMVPQTDLNIYQLTNPHFCSSTRWWLNDSAGWVGLFSDGGIPVSVVYWSVTGLPSDLYNYPLFKNDLLADPQKCSCCTVGFIEDPANTPGVEYAGQTFPGSGLSLSRKIDGSSTWISGPVGGTPKACNGGIDSCFTRELVFASDPPTCHNGNDGSLSVSIEENGISLQPYTYHWSNNSFNDTIINLSAGSYTITVNDIYGCPITTSYTLLNTPALTIPVSSNSPVCPGDTIFLFSNYSAQNYQWSGPSAFISNGANPYILNSSSSHTGNYTLSITDNDGCPGTALLTVSLQPFPDDLFASDATICKHETLILKAPDNGNFQYSWSVPSSSAQAEVYSPKTLLVQNPYWVTLTLTGCKSITDSVLVTVEDCPLVIPNVFTPNADGYNDFFVIKDLEHYPGSSLVIFERGGKIVFRSDDYQNNWEAGKHADGVYYYVLNAFSGNGEYLPYRGTITLLK
ncbi:MAG: gliding motility-associated C-terminal domain-containing protein [Bacteroidota bacterium]